VVAETAALAPSVFVKDAWLIALLPFVSAALTLFVGKRTPGKGSVYGITAMAVGLVMSLGVLWHFVNNGGPYEANVSWFQIGPLAMQLGEYVDGLTAIMLVVVTAISLCVHVYSLGYMKDDVRYTWFYVVLSLFTGAMLNVVIASNLFQLLVGWEVMGVCSYLLIGHWWEDKTNSNAAIKAFITTRVGDVPFMFGIFALIFATGFTTSNIQVIGHTVAEGHVSSALVAAGVYLEGRLFEVFVHADAFVLQTVGVVGAITMVGAAFLAFVQDDIKRVLAYSTVSQLAYMVVGMSMGPAGRTAGFFHLFTHAFFKALLFLGAGSVIHAVHANNMSEMGGLRKKLPITFWTFLIGSLALAGVPPLAGFWSKDELLVVADHTGHTVLFAVLLATALLTAFYMTRAVLMTFFGEYRGHAQPQKSPKTMTGVLVALAAASIGVGLLGAPQLGSVFGTWVFFGEVEKAVFVPWVAGVSVAAAALGIVFGWLVYRTYQERDPIRQLGPAYTLLEQKYYMDTFYMKGIVFPIRDKVSAGVYWINQHVIDGAVNATAPLTKLLARFVNAFDRKAIDGAVNGAAQTAGFTGGILRYVQSGNVQRYAAFLFAGVVIFAIIFTRV
jgi:NADH-quinone oxidoreductase subunit L